MLSIPDMAVLGAVALILFGPEQLPKVARRAGQVVRDIQNTSQSFIREMERAAEVHETPANAATWNPMDPPAEFHTPAEVEHLAEPRPPETPYNGSIHAEPAPHADPPAHVERPASGPDPLPF